MEFLNENNLISKAMEYIEERTRLPRFFQFSIMAAVTALWLAYGHGAPVLCNLISFIYPAHESIKAIKTEDKEGDTKWFMYWTIFGFLTCLDYFLDEIPFYYLMKTIILIWCHLPIEYNGSMIIYNEVILGLFVRHHEQINAMIEAAGRQMAIVIEILMEKGKIVPEAVLHVTARLAEFSKGTAMKMADLGKEAITNVTKKCKERVVKAN